MKIIHCADIHLDSKMQTNLGETRARERKAELLNTFVRLVEYARDNMITVILISGDLFDSKNISALTRNRVLGLFNDNPDISFYYLRGNHDADAFLDGLETIPDNLFTFGDEVTEYALGDRDLIRIYGGELENPDSYRIQNSINPDPSNINIVMLHGQETVSSAKDKTAVIDIRTFKDKGIDYMALGHIHAYRREKLDDRGIYCYPGCLDPRGFDEPGEHGFVVLDIDEETKKVKDTFVPFATRHVYEVNTDITGTENSGEILQRVKTAISNSRASERDIVRVFLTGETDEECEIEPEYLTVSLKEGFYAFRLTDESHVKVNYAKYLKDESLKGEFVRLCLKDDTMDEEKRGKVIRMGLAAISGGDVL